MGRIPTRVGKADHITGHRFHCSDITKQEILRDDSYRALVSSQTALSLFHLPKHLRAEDFDGDAVISIFDKVLSHEDLTHGLTYILKNLESRQSQRTDRDRIISEGISIAMSVLTGRTTF